ncbi:non-histone chromosomal protein HMG-14 [Cynocephalus volans]|uniref:non-histone chromosomal protein HMG-14 n=1 Tax=Cynocephalus volans TaxID=110931 RepID=UPI002FCC7709
MLGTKNLELKTAGTSQPDARPPPTTANLPRKKAPRLRSGAPHRAPSHALLCGACAPRPASPRPAKLGTPDSLSSRLRWETFARSCPGGLWGPPARPPGSWAPRDGGRGRGLPSAGAGQRGRVTVGLTYSGRGLKRRGVGPAASGRGRAVARPARRGSPRPGDAGGGGGGLPIRFHPVLPPPPPRVLEARAAGGAAAAQQPSFAKALGAPRPAGTRHAPSPPPGCPRGRSAQPKGQRKRSPRGDQRGCQLNLLLQKWKRSQKRQQPSERAKLGLRPGETECDKSSDKKVQTKGKRGAKGKQAEVTNQETKEDLPAENGETKNEESPASDEAGEKEAKSD